MAMPVRKARLRSRAAKVTARVRKLFQPKKPAPAATTSFPAEMLYGRALGRLSTLTGISAALLQPMPSSKKITARGEYFPHTHEMTVRGFQTSGQKKWVGEHERLHSLQIPLTPANQFEVHLTKPKKTRVGRYLARKKKESNIISNWIEPTVTVPSVSPYREALSTWGSPRRSLKYSGVGFLAAFFTGTTRSFGPIPALASIALLAHGYSKNMRQRLPVRKMMEKHGEDGLLMLWAFPPQKLDSREIPKWQNEWEQKGILKPAGGFTPAGEKFFGENVRHRLIRFLTEVNAERLKQLNKKK